MTYFTEGIRVLLNERKTRQAVDKLLGILENGETEIHQRALNLAFSKENSDDDGESNIMVRKRVSAAQVRDFLDQLEVENNVMVEFLTHLATGEAYLAKKAWKEARPHLKLAFQSHQEAFNIDRADLQEKIDQCEDAISFLYFVEKGNDFFKLGSWQSARSNYKKALNHQLPPFRKKIQQVKEKINICGQGIEFEQNIDQAQGLYNQKKWADASFFYQRALQLHHEGFKPERQTLIDILAECREKSEESRKKGVLTGFLFSKPGLYTLIFFGLTALFLFYFYPAKTQLEQIPPVKDGLKAKLVDSVEQAGVKDTLASDSSTSVSNEVANSSETETAALDSTTRFTSSILPGEGPFAIKEPEEIQIPISDLAEIDSSGLYPDPSEDSLSLKTDVVKYTPGRVAVIPFCNGTEDEDFAKRLYLDASYAIRSSNSGKFSSVSRSSVSGVIQKLGYQPTNFCSETDAIRVAQTLGVESIVVGNIIPMPDEQVRIICEVLHIPSRQYSREITLTDRDMDRLRRNLRTEIQQIFY
jgi:tetratricopeptide (TPR) repeat protein